MPNADPKRISDPDRIAALKAYCLLDTPADAAFDRLTRLAARLLKVPVAMVSLVDVDRQFFKSQIGLAAPLDELRQTPLSHSFCQHVVADSAPLIIDDARQHPLVYDNLAVIDDNVVAYAGIPLIESGGQALGSFCVIDYEPRQWTEDEIEFLTELAASVMTEVELRAEIRERQRVELALREAEERYRTVVNSMYEGVVLQYREGGINTCNPAAERILGLSAAQIMGLTPTDQPWRAIHEDGTPFPSETYPATMTFKTGQAQSNVIMGLYKPNGDLTWILVNAQPLKADDNPLPYAVVVTFVDITARKQFEQHAMMLELEKARVQLLAQFIEHSSHEFRTPLAVMQSSLYLLNKTDDPARRQQKVKTIEDQITRITQVVDTLQKMSHLDSQTTLASAPTDVTQLVQNVVDQFASSDTKRLEFRLQQDVNIPRIQAAAYHLQDALAQIVDNARRFTPHGGMVTICTRLHGEQIVITIIDNGIGMSEAVLPHIFERFYRFDEAHSTPGFGLGLPIAQSIIQKHGGSITVASALGQGTTVTIRLPIG